MRQKQFRLFYYSALILFLSGTGCDLTHTQYDAVGDVTTLQGLTTVKKIRARNKDKSQVLRIKAIRDYGFSVGAQAGCAARTAEIRALLDELHDTLDRVYSFNLWMLPHKILPPVLIEGQRAIHLSDTKTIRVAERTYEIYKDAKFVSTPPHWRYDYLLKDSAHLMQKPSRLAADLLPSNDHERSIWEAAVKKGWQSGVEQARHNFITNLRALARDLNGMILYRQLLAKGMISPPFVSHSELGVTGDAQRINIQDQLLRITELPKLIRESKSWKPIFLES